MARKVVQFLIDQAGRDQGKMFQLTEMPASQAEKWAMRAFLAMSASGVTVPDDVAKAGLAGIATLGLKALAGVSFERAEPLMEEMFGCITRIVDPAKPQFARALVEDDIEEVTTRLRLRTEVFKLHVDFFIIAERLNSLGQSEAA